MPCCTDICNRPARYGRVDRTRLVLWPVRDARGHRRSVDACRATATGSIPGPWGDQAGRGLVITRTAFCPSDGARKYTSTGATSQDLALYLRRVPSDAVAAPRRPPSRGERVAIRTSRNAPPAYNSIARALFHTTASGPLPLGHEAILTSAIISDARLPTLEQQEAPANML